MATTVADPVFVDTNVLVYSRFPASPLCVPAAVKLEELFRANAAVWASRQILREYATSLTRPQNYRIRRGAPLKVGTESNRSPTPRPRLRRVLKK